MAISLSNTGNFTGRTDTFSGIVSVGSGPNQCFVTAVAFRAPIAVTGSLGGYPLTFQLQSNTSPNPSLRAALFYLPNPPAGDQTLEIGFPATTDYIIAYGTLSGVDLNNPIGVSNGASGQSAAPEVALSGVTPGSWVMGSMIKNNLGDALSAGQTEVYQIERNGVDDLTLGWSYAVTTGANAALSWAISTTRQWAIEAIEFLAAPAGAGGRQFQAILL